MKKKEVKHIVKTASHPYLVVELLVGVFTSIGMVLLFLFIVQQTLKPEFIAFDQVVTHFVTSLRTPFLNQVMMVITIFGNEFIFSTSVIFIAVAAAKKHIGDSILYAYIVGGGALLNLVLKFLIDRPRPERALIEETYSSLPSGHAMNSFIFYATLAYFTYHFTHNKKLTVIVALGSTILVGLIGISRIYLGVHYPTDIIAGYIAGFWWFCTSLFMHRTIKYLRIRSNN